MKIKITVHHKSEFLKKIYLPSAIEKKSDEKKAWVTSSELAESII